MSELLWLCPFLVAYCAVAYTYVIRCEEAHLTMKYGQSYIEFQERVPRWLPLRRAWTALAPAADARPFLLRSIRTELPIILLLALPLLKELL